MQCGEVEATMASLSLEGLAKLDAGGPRMFTEWLSPDWHPYWSEESFTHETGDVPYVFYPPWEAVQAPGWRLPVYHPASHLPRLTVGSPGVQQTMQETLLAAAALGQIAAEHDTRYSSESDYPAVPFIMQWGSSSDLSKDAFLAVTGAHHEILRATPNDAWKVYKDPDSLLAGEFFVGSGAAGDEEDEQGVLEEWGPVVKGLFEAVDGEVAVLMAGTCMEGVQDEVALNPFPVFFVGRTRPHGTSIIGLITAAVWS